MSSSPRVNFPTAQILSLQNPKTWRPWQAYVIHSPLSPWKNLQALQNTGQYNSYLAPKSWLPLQEMRTQISLVCTKWFTRFLGWSPMKRTALSMKPLESTLQRMRKGMVKGLPSFGLEMIWEFWTMKLWTRLGLLQKWCCLFTALILVFSRLPTILVSQKQEVSLSDCIFNDMWDVTDCCIWRNLCLRLCVFSIEGPIFYGMLGWLEKEFVESWTEFAHSTWETRGNHPFSSWIFWSSHSWVNVSAFLWLMIKWMF